MSTSTGFIFIRIIVFVAASGSCGFVYSTAAAPASIDKPPSLSNFVSDQNQQKKLDPVSDNTTIVTKSKMEKIEQTTTDDAVVHKLLNVPINNGTGSIFLNINLHKMMEDPYVHGVVLPAAVGMIVALLTLFLVCSIRSCVRSQARKRRKRRIRNLAEELKADQKVLLAADSDDDEI